MEILGIANGLKIPTNNEEVDGIIMAGAGFFYGGVNRIEGAVALEEGPVSKVKGPQGMK